MAEGKRTPLYEEHLKLGARMVEFAGWEMPLNYLSGIIAEHLATRRYGGLFDISHMGRFLISGQDAVAFMQYALTNNVLALEPGQAQYTIIATESGGAVDDAYLYRIGVEEYLLVVNAANTDNDWRWFEEHRRRFSRLVLEDHTKGIGMLSLQGPKAKAVLEAILGGKDKLPEPARNRLVTDEVSGARVPISRTGYTGEPVGFELFPPAEVAVDMWQKVLEIGKAQGIIPIGLGARDTLRLEAGLPLYGQELGTDVDGDEIPLYALPQARGAVSFHQSKGEFIGREALMKQFREITLRRERLLDLLPEKLLVARMIMPLAIIGNRVARQGCRVYVGERLVGTVTSGTVVPYWKVEGSGLQSRLSDETGRKSICLAYLDADLEAGQRTRVDIRGKMAEGIIVDRHLAGNVAPYARPMLAGE
jgi:aminomethyltransferase